MIEQSKIHEIKGVGEKTEKLFAKLGIYTVGDLLRYYPRNYDVYEEAVPIAEVEDGRTVTVTGMIFGRVQVGGKSELAGDDHSRKRSDGDNQSSLVSYAVS